jgi:hypothetical protein
MRKGEWTFLTNHGRLFIFLAKHPKSTAQVIAQEASLSIRAVQNIITDLETEGYVTSHKEGRCNQYTVNPGIPMRHPLERDHLVGDILFALGYEPQKEPKSGKDVSTTPAKV